MTRDEITRVLVQALAKGEATTITMKDGKELTGYIDEVGPEQFVLDSFGDIYKGLINDMAEINGETVKGNYE